MTQQNKTEKKPFFYGYVIVGLSSLVNVLLGGSLYTFSVFFEPLSGEFGWTRALTSGAFSLYMFLHGFLYILTGRLNDRYGPRIVLSGCGLFMGIGYMLMSLVSEVWHVYLFYGVVIAVGMSGGYVPITSTVTRWFESDSRRGLMIGISIAGTGLGTMIMPPIANWLISSYGWQTSYVIIGIMVLVLIMAAAQFMRRAPESAVQTGADGKAILKKGLTIGQAMRTRQFWLLSISYFGFGLFLQAIMVHIVVHALGLGISPAAAANIFIAIGGLSLLGRIGMGFICDRIGNKNVIIICFVLMSASFIWMLFAKELWSIILFAGVFGFAYGGLVSAQSPIIADLFGIRSHGVILGAIVSIITIGSAIGPVMAGAIFDSTSSYNWAFIFCLGFSLISLVLTLLLKPITSGGEK